MSYPEGLFYASVFVVSILGGGALAYVLAPAVPRFVNGPEKEEEDPKDEEDKKVTEEEVSRDEGLASKRVLGTRAASRKK